MAEKLKVSRELAWALKDLFARKKDDYSYDEILKLHYEALKGERWKGETWEHLNKLSMAEMAQAMFIGYEIEETPEEQFIKWYKDFCPAIPGDAICLEVIHKTIEILGIKIKGFNE
ncbi:hypothetical protein KQI46_08870 [Lysinibacillus capsici]|uniref:hypothetical protein n=1 Tax=Lysinibacillus capsici TaxID=2115968 RepID=UPI001C0FF2D0|nr:hypothetical protein [Lysinibacillus capsici]MBU5252051.1 hypothetical protein [Lysinibacillus capsici]